MKIRNFTSSESNKLIAIIIERDRLVMELNELCITVMLREYEKYLKNFKYSFSSPLTFRPMSKDKFISSMMGGGGIYKVKAGRFLESVGKNDAQYLFGWRKDRTWEFDDEKFNSALWMADAASTVVIHDTKDDDDFIHILLNYAHQPFEFNEKDIERVMRWKRDVTIMAKTVQVLKDELQAK